jgi:hypothetical protein
MRNNQQARRPLGNARAGAIPGPIAGLGYPRALGNS